MINFCSRFLGFSKSPHLDRPSRGDGLSLLVAGELQEPTNVLISHAVKPPPGKPPVDLQPRFFFQDIDGNGLGSCTESLGFESSDEIGAGAKPTVESGFSESRCRRRRASTKEVKFPPPLTSLNRNGQRNFYLKTVREDGRMLIAIVNIERQEMMRASREDGRLRLHLIKQQQQHEEETNDISAAAAAAEEEEEEKEEKMRQRQYPLTGGDGFRRCHELNNSHLSMWNARCVTTT